MYSTIELKFVIPKSGNEKLTKYVTEKVRTAVKTTDKLMGGDFKAIGTDLTTLLHKKLAMSTSKNGGKAAGKASLALSSKKNTYYSLTDEVAFTESPSGYGSSKIYSFKLNMDKYGFIIGEDSFVYKPTIETAVQWIKNKQALGEKFYVRKYNKDGSERTSYSPVDEKDYTSIAFAMRYGVKSPTVAIPNWYRIWNLKNEAVINTALQNMANLTGRNIANTISKQ